MEGVAQLDIEVGMCEQDTRIEEVVLRAVQRLGFADLRPQQMVAIKTFMQGKDVFVSLPTGYGKSLIYSVLPYAYDELRGCRGSTDSHRRFTTAFANEGSGKTCVTWLKKAMYTYIGPALRTRGLSATCITGEIRICKSE